MLHIKPKNNEIKDMYVNHGTYHKGDCGLDLFCLEDQTFEAHSLGNTIRFGISCELCNDPRLPKYIYLPDDRGYILVPRSSISSTPLRMSNSVGIIDSSYRGEIMAKVDNLSNNSYYVKKGTRLFQLVMPDLKPFEFKVVDTLSESTRGEGGFGSTN